MSPQDQPAWWRSGPWAVVTCVTAACTRCGTTGEDEDAGYTEHYTTVEQARSRLVAAGWRFSPGGDGAEDEMLCRDCAAKDDCACLGHQAVTGDPFLMSDGRVLGKHAWCERCGMTISREPGTPAPPGYPEPGGGRRDLYWDGAALPRGDEITSAAERLVTRLSDDAVAARWDAWPGSQEGRPARRAEPDPEADKAAALTLIKAGHQLLCAATGVGTSVPAVPL